MALSKFVEGAKDGARCMFDKDSPELSVTFVTSED